MNLWAMTGGFILPVALYCLGYDFYYCWILAYVQPCALKHGLTRRFCCLLSFWLAGFFFGPSLLALIAICKRIFYAYLS
jgi:hypothetical protein